MFATSQLKNSLYFQTPLSLKVSKNCFFKKCRAHLVQKYNLSSRHFSTRFINDQSANIVNILSICEVNEAKLSTTEVFPPGKPLSPVQVIQVPVIIISLLLKG